MPLDGLRHAAVPCHSLASQDPAVMMQFVICTASTCIADIVVTSLTCLQAGAVVHC